MTYPLFSHKNITTIDIDYKTMATTTQSLKKIIIAASLLYNIVSHLLLIYFV